MHGTVAFLYVMRMFHANVPCPCLQNHLLKNNFPDRFFTLCDKMPKGLLENRPNLCITQTIREYSEGTRELKPENGVELPMLIRDEINKTA